MFTILVGIVCFLVGSKVHPALKKETDGYYLHYTAGKGVRNKVKLFSKLI